jgi:hypothetical protein
MRFLNKKNIILVVVLFLVVATVITISNSRFRLIETTPSITGEVPTSTNGFKLYFNREIVFNTEQITETVNSVDQIKDIEVGKDYLIVVILEPLIDSENVFEINGVNSTSGDKLNTIKFNYKGKYIQKDRLSDEHLELISYIANIKPENKIITILPYSTLDYYLSEAYFEDEEESGDIGTFYINARINLSAYDLREGRQKSIDAYKKEISNYITSKGFKIEDQDINYEILD